MVTQRGLQPLGPVPGAGSGALSEPGAVATSTGTRHRPAGGLGVLCAFVGSKHRLDSRTPATELLESGGCAESGSQEGKASGRTQGHGFEQPRGPPWKEREEKNSEGRSSICSHPFPGSEFTLRLIFAQSCQNSCSQGRQARVGLWGPEPSPGPIARPPRSCSGRLCGGGVEGTRGHHAGHSLTLFSSPNWEREKI